MTEEKNTWDDIYTDLVELGSWETYAKVNVYELTNHLDQLYSKIEGLEKQVNYLQKVAISHDYRNNLGL
jgi:hypothetical protein